MNRVITICNTYFQLICMIQIRLTLLKDSQVTLVLSDHSINAEEIYRNIKKEKVFDEVVYWKSKSIDYAKKKNFNTLKIIINGVAGLKSCVDLKNEIYDLFMFYNYGISESVLFSQLYQKNKKIVCARFEEGISSYNHKINMPNNDIMPHRLKMIAWLRHLFKKPELYDCTDSFYCYYPELYKGNLKVVRIPLVSKDNRKLKIIIRNIFDIKDEDLIYPQKYIFFGSVADIEGEEPIGESELVIKIAEKVGKRNILIKTHPRDDASVYNTAGLCVDRNSSKPWEAIQLCKDFSGYVFVSTVSSSVLTGNMVVDNPAKVYFMYKLCECDKNSVAKNAIKAIEIVLNECRDRLDYITVADNLSNILE